MTGTLLFVHGTGVRKAGYERSCDAIRVGCATAGLGDVRLVGVPWGEKLGITTELIKRTLPAAATRAAAGEPEPGEQTVAEWDILLEDPLFELRLAAEADGGAASGFTVGTTPPEVALAQKVSALSQAPSLDLGEAGVSHEELAMAAQAVAASAELAGAARGAGAAEAAELADTVARAVVASLLSPYRLAPTGEAPALAYNAALRDQLVEQIAELLAPGTTRGLRSWLGKRVGGFAARRATSFLEVRRGAITVGGLPFLGDILHYQKRGDEIRSMVAAEIAKATAPIVAVGHSLGGIILVDLLTREMPPAVDRLVTVGSQSPLFYAIDALDRIRRRAAGPEPTPFTPWLNIYDRADILSFLAGRVFPGLGDVRDEEIDARVPFPSAHSAYFHQPRTFELIAGFWPK
jgi:hypothetical protein